MPESIRGRSLANRGKKNYVNANTESEDHGLEEENEEQMGPPDDADWREDNLVP